MMNPALYERFNWRGEDDFVDKTCFLTLHRIGDVDNRSARTRQSSRGTLLPHSASA
jgi:hypothetical protein